MATQVLRELLHGHLGELRYQPTPKRVRAMIGDELVVDSEQAVLVWEPDRPVPSYAVPVEDVFAELTPVDREPPPETDRPGGLHPGIPFAVHSTPGQAVTLTTGRGERREDAAFRAADEDLADYVVLDFRAFDRWLEEDEEIIGHPRDPFHRIDIRRSSRNIRIELDGQMLAESTRPVLVFETSLPTRYYLPREDVRTELLRPSATSTTCAYKGHASYWSVHLGDEPVKDLVWTYEQPLADAHELTGLMACFDERADVFVDGQRLERPDTPWRTRTDA
jgi:uncharacterized protein (DUF427 family)